MSERHARSEMTPEQQRRFDARRDNRELHNPTEYLIALAIRLRDGELLPHGARAWLSSALIETAFNPQGGARALGLVAPPNRPKADHSKLLKALYIVDCEVANGTRQSSGRKEGAFDKAATATGLSPDLVKREWQEHQRFVRAHRKAEESGI